LSTIVQPKSPPTLPILPPGRHNGQMARHLTEPLDQPCADLPNVDSPRRYLPFDHLDRFAPGGFNALIAPKTAISALPIGM
jgi:hypothetical protein